MRLLGATVALVVFVSGASAQAGSDTDPPAPPPAQIQLKKAQPARPHQLTFLGHVVKRAKTLWELPRKVRAPQRRVRRMSYPEHRLGTQPTRPRMTTIED
jgi:hypothetical protein